MADRQNRLSNLAARVSRANLTADDVRTYVKQANPCTLCQYDDSQACDDCKTYSAWFELESWIESLLAKRIEVP
jgi:hypothetical protein